MNATRAATIRLRSSFDGAVSLGRVQTPTLAIIARREEEIRAFVPEPYWLVDATLRAAGGEPGRRYAGRFHAGAQPRLTTAAEAEAIVAAVRGRRGRDHQAREDEAHARSAPLLYDLTSLQREANTRFGFSARRTLRPRSGSTRSTRRSRTRVRTRASCRRTWSARSSRSPRSSATHREYAQAAAYVTGLDVLPLGRVINDAKVTDHHAIIPTNSEHQRRQDVRRRPARSTTWSSGASSPSSTPTRCSRTRAWRRRSPSTSSAPAAASWSSPGWRGVYGEGPRGGAAPTTTTRARDQQLPKLEQGESVAHARGRPRRRRRPSRRGATPTRRCWARWRPPASSSTTTSCARR